MDFSYYLIRCVDTVLHGGGGESFIGVGQTQAMQVIARGITVTAAVSTPHGRSPLGALGPAAAMLVTFSVQ